jgi:hypothetical protein
MIRLMASWGSFDMTSSDTPLPRSSVYNPFGTAPNRKNSNEKCDVVDMLSTIAQKPRFETYWFMCCCYSTWTLGNGVILTRAKLDDG